MGEGYDRICEDCQIVCEDCCCEDPSWMKEEANGCS